MDTTESQWTDDPEPFDIHAIERPHPNLLKQYAISSLVGLIAAPIIFVPLFFKYYTLRYKFDEEGVSARWGILFRREIHLTYKRIQDIHVKRNVVERWLGLGAWSTTRRCATTFTGACAGSLVERARHEPRNRFRVRRRAQRSSPGRRTPRLSSCWGRSVTSSKACGAS